MFYVLPFDFHVLIFKYVLLFYKSFVFFLVIFTYLVAKVSLAELSWSTSVWRLLGFTFLWLGLFLLMLIECIWEANSGSLLQIRFAFTSRTNWHSMTFITLARCQRVSSTGVWILWIHLRHQKLYTTMICMLFLTMPMSRWYLLLLFLFFNLLGSLLYLLFLLNIILRLSNNISLNVLRYALHIITVVEGR